MATLDDFIVAPSEEGLEQFTKDQLLKLASHYGIEIPSSDKSVKKNVKETLKSHLLEQGILKPEPSKEIKTPALTQISDEAIELRLRELALRELELEEKQKERMLREKEMHLEHERFLKELEFKHASLSSSTDSETTGFDIHKNMRLVPPFVEKDVEKYFPHFERVATISKWPKHSWSMLLQSVLVGRAQEAFTTLRLEEIQDYDKVKSAVLKSYELVPEAYRQRFRELRKLDQQTYVEFSKEKETLFDRWCTSQSVETQEDLRQLVLLEEFKHCLPNAVCTYLNEQKVKTLDRAAVLADEFALTHKQSFDKDHVEQRKKTLFQKTNPSRSFSAASGYSRKSSTVNAPAEKVCFYCKKPGHLIAECPVLGKKQKAPKPVALIKTVQNSTLENVEKPEKVKLAGSSSFLMDGFVSLDSDSSKRLPIKIWRDTGAFQSLILQDFLPFSEKSSLGSNALVEGFGGGYLHLPMHTLNLQTSLVSGSVDVAICPYIPIDGVSFILGNDLAGDRVAAAPM